MNIKEIKNQGKLAFKANYWKCVLVAFLLSLLTIGSTAGSGTSSKASTKEAQDKFTESFNAMSASDQKEFVAIVLGALAIVFTVSFLLKIFLFNPLQVGGYRFFKNNLNDSNTGVGVVAEGFGGYGHIWLTLFLRDLFWTLWTCLFLIPGIIKYYSYLMVPYIIKDNPELSATEAITRSREMMNGHKMEAFLMDLSFIGWYILGGLTFDLVNIFWTQPYHQSARAKFYTELM